MYRLQGTLGTISTLTHKEFLPLLTSGMRTGRRRVIQKMRTKRPELNDVHVEQDVPDRDNEQMGNNKAYADMQRNARYSEVLPGDQVLVQQF